MKITFITSLLILLNWCLHPQTASHLHPAPWLAALSAPSPALYVGLRESTRPSDVFLSVAMVMNGSLKACDLYSLSAGERKCDLMLCPDSPAPCLQRCSCVEMWDCLYLSALTWGVLTSHWTKVLYWTRVWQSDKGQIILISYYCNYLIKHSS